MRPVWAEVDLGAITHNLSAIKSLLKPETKLCAVVKANAYGHGTLPVAMTAIHNGADWLAVAIWEEAAEIRRAGYTGPILVLGPSAAEDAPFVVANDLSQTICSLDQARQLSAAAKNCGRTAKIHIKIDTGMSRIGVSPEQFKGLALAVAELPSLEVEGIFTHFATADAVNKTLSYRQFDLFEACIGSLEMDAFLKRPIIHCCNSAATFSLPEAHLDMVRIGIAMYGIWPSPHVESSIRLRPAFSMKCGIRQIKTLPSGTPVSYGATYLTQGEQIVATLPVGYADGIPRGLTNKGSVLVNGKIAPMIGTICMDQCMVDVTAVARVQSGGEVTLFGDARLPVETVARQVDTIPNEILTRIGERVPRRYINRGSDA